MKKQLVLVAWLGFILGLTGCGAKGVANHIEFDDLQPVVGEIRFKGEPIPDASVRLHPVTPVPGSDLATTTPMEVWVCPSAPSTRLVPDAASQDNHVPYPNPGFGHSDYSSTNEVRRSFYEGNGLPLPLGIQRGMPGALERNIANRLADISDGLSNTMLIAERSGRPGIYWRNKVSAGLVVADGWGWADCDNVSGSLNGCSADGMLVNKTGQNSPFTSTIHGGCGINCTNNSEFYSWHPGGMNMSLADGSVRYLAETVAPQVLAGLVTRAGGEPLSGF